MVIKRKLAAPKPSGGGIRRPLKAKNDFAAPPKHAVKKGGAFSKVAVEKKKAAVGQKPWNVIVPVGGKLTVYLLDEGEPFATYEHLNYGGTKTQRGRDLPCIQDGSEPCPICLQSGKEGTYVMYLTAIIPRETYTKKGDKSPTTRLYQKKLLQIKIKMANVWQRIYEEHGTFRGLVVELIRDGKLDPISGNEVRFVRKLPEAKIKQYATGFDVNDKDAKDYIIKAEVDKVFDYEKFFPSPDANTLSQMAGLGNVTAGMRLGEEDSDGWGTGDAESSGAWGEDG